MSERVRAPLRFHRIIVLDMPTVLSVLVKASVACTVKRIRVLTIGHCFAGESVSADAEEQTYTPSTTSPNII